MNSLVAVAQTCGQNNVAGVEKLYMIAYSDLAAAAGAVAGEVFTKATNGMVNAIGLDSGKKFVEIGTLKDGVGFVSNGTIDVAKGLSYDVPTLNVNLGDLSIDFEKFVKDVTLRPVVAMIKSRTGKWFIAGLNGQFWLSQRSASVGAALGDDYGYKLTFEGVELDGVTQVDPTIVSGLIA
jgi:hypothetical protein